MRDGQSTPKDSRSARTRYRRSTSLGVGLAIVVLGWGAVASVMDPEDPPDEGYGPVEELLLHSEGDPPSPSPSARGSCPIGSRPSGPRMQEWTPFFRDLQLDLQFRSFSFNRELPIRPTPPTDPTVLHQEAWALGGWIGLESGWLLDTFRLGATGYTSQPADAPDDRDRTGLLALGQEGITVLGQAYGQLRYKDYARLTGGACWSTRAS
jgi:hypothetical protein